MRAHQDRSRHSSTSLSSRFSLTEQEFEVISSELPKKYSLVTVDDWNLHLAQKQQAIQKNSKQMQDENEQPKTQETPKPRFHNIETPKLTESGSNVEQNQQTPIKQQSLQRKQPTDEESEQKRSKYGKEQARILHLIKMMVEHQEFVVIFKANLQPTAQEQVRIMKDKLIGNYTIPDFQADVDRLFANYFELVGQQERVAKFKKIINSNIKKCQNGLKQAQNQSASHSQIKLANEERTEHPMTPTITQASKQKEMEKSEKSKKEFSSQDDLPALVKEEKETTNIRLRLRGDEPPAPFHVTNNQLIAVGFNLRKLPSVDLQWICKNFPSQSRQKLNRAEYFNLDLQTFSAKELCRLEDFVRNRLRAAGIRYEQTPHEDGDFVIEDDDE